MSASESENDPTPSDDESGYDASAHAAAIKRLKSKDPEFYEFLQAHDKELLNFEDTDEPDEDHEEEEDEEEEEEEPAAKKLSASQLQYIKKEIQKSPSIKVCKQLILAFKHAVQQADGVAAKCDMSNSDLYNDIIKICLIELVPALRRVLKLSLDDDKKSLDPSKSKFWKKYRSVVKVYLIEVIKLSTLIKEPTVLIPLLKHTIHLIPFYSQFIKLSRSLLKRVISLWCSNEETVRVLSLIIVVRTTKSLPKEYLGGILKTMYFSYVKNTKFTSPTSWPMINFMKRSLAEVYSINPKTAYEHAFVYIRQLAIHLRNALTTKKKESFQTVYNWQYVHCIMFWSHLLCRLHEHEALKSLVYPLVQTIVGTINLIPTARYVPLRFHLVGTLIHISKETGHFIPTLPFILDVLTLIDCNKKMAFSVKEFNFTCALKVTKSQLQEAGFREKCIAEVCELLLVYFKVYSHSVGFPELALPALLQIKAFMKQCKVSKYNQQLKNVLSKIEENAAFITEKRRSATFEITNSEAIKKWEQDILESKPPLLKVNKPALCVENKKSTPKAKRFKKSHKNQPERRIKN